MSAEHSSEAAALVAALRMVGMTLRLDGGELDITGRPKVLAVWQAIDAAIEGLGELVAGALRAELEAADPLPAPIVPTQPDPLDSWTRMSGGRLDTMMQHAMVTSRECWLPW
jgi:hypothetical protein